MFGGKCQSKSQDGVVCGEQEGVDRIGDTVKVVLKWEEVV